MDILSIQGTRDSVQLANPGQIAPEPGFEEALWRTAIPPGDPPPIAFMLGLEELAIQSPNAESKTTDPQTEIPLTEMALLLASFGSASAPVVDKLIATDVNPEAQSFDPVLENPLSLLQKQPPVKQVVELEPSADELLVDPFAQTSAVGALTQESGKTSSLKVGIELNKSTSAVDILETMPPLNEKVAQKNNSDSMESGLEHEADDTNESPANSKPHTPSAPTFMDSATPEDTKYPVTKLETNVHRTQTNREAILDHIEGVAIRNNPNVTINFESEQGVSSVEVSHHNGQVQMHFVTENQTVRAALESSKTDLDRSLRDAGYQGSQMTFDSSEREGRQLAQPSIRNNFLMQSDESSDAPTRKSLWGLEILA